MAANLYVGFCIESNGKWRVFRVHFDEIERNVMSDAPIMAIAGVGAALMAASGAMSAERLAIAGVAVIFVAAAWKFAKARRNRFTRRSGEDRRHDANAEQANAEPPVVIGSR
jgi:hypothetical protein